MKLIEVKEVREWMDHCLKIQKAMGYIHTASYKQFRGYSGLAAQASKLHWIAREPVEFQAKRGAPKTSRVVSIWKLEPVTDEHAKHLLKAYREHQSELQAKRYMRDNPPIEPDEIDEDEPTNEAKTYTADEVSSIVEETVARVMQGLKVPAGSTAIDQVPEPEADALTGYEVTPADLLHEQQKTNALLSRLVRVWTK